MECVAAFMDTEGKTAACGFVCKIVLVAEHVTLRLENVPASPALMELIACLMCALMIAQGMAHVTLALDFVNAMWTTSGSIAPPQSVEKNTWHHIFS